MNVVGGLFQALVMLLGFAVWLLPIAVAIWVLQRLSAMSRDMTVLKQQLAVMAEHSGAPIVPPPPQRRSPRTPLWAFAAVLVVVLLLMAALYAAPGMSWRMESTELEFVEDSSVPRPADQLPPMPEPVQKKPAR